MSQLHVVLDFVREGDVLVITKIGSHYNNNSPTQTVRVASGPRAGGGLRKRAIQNCKKSPSARKIARLMTISRDRLSKADALLAAAIEVGTPALAQTRLY